MQTRITPNTDTFYAVTRLVFCVLDYNPSNGFEILKTQPISKAQARQRCGRAVREAPGICYRLYPEKSFFQLKEEAVPEIQRCNLKSKEILISLLCFLAEAGHSVVR